MTMICDSCGQIGIRWMGAPSNLTHTECLHCGGRNCQRVNVELVDENDCPGHVASEGYPKICGRCGVHIDSLRPDEFNGPEA